MGRLSIRVDDYPGTKPAEFSKHNLKNFLKFDQVMCERYSLYTLGVIPRYVGLEELRELGSRSHIELAMHGIDHDERYPNEFDAHDEPEVILLNRELARFEEMAGKKPSVYIPPHNVIDIQTVRALGRTGFKKVMTGPGLEKNFTLSGMDAVCKTMGLEHVYSGHQFADIPGCFWDYGRSDELLRRGAISIIKKNLETQDVCLTLHWTWEHNVGLQNLDEFMRKLRD